VALEKAIGAVAILDALGTSTQTDQEIAAFVEGRNRILGLLNGKAEDVELEGVKTFTFGDTILITLASTADSLADDCTKLMMVLRKFLVDSLAHGLLFRGAVAVGEHHTDNDTNTVLGAAVNDAAGWYEQADWIGLHMTPLSSMKVDEWGARDDGPGTHLIVDYDVPLKSGTQELKVINWPKVLYLPKVAPPGAERNPRAFLLRRLTSRPIPPGVEAKFRNTIDFFEHVVRKQHLSTSKRKKKATTREPVGVQNT
jgi:hypothetical protein